MRTFHSCFGILITLGLLLSSCDKGHKANPPNILFIAIDDLNDWTGFLGGHPQARTPNMDALAAESYNFTCAHATAAACQPSRNSILWGLHPTRTGWYENLWKPDILDEVGDSLNRISTALPEFFRNAGYRTMMTGKIFHSGPADARGMEAAFWDEIQEPYTVDPEIKRRGDGYGGSFFHPFPYGGSPITHHFGKGTGGQSLCGGPLVRERDLPSGEMPDEYFASWGEKKLAQEYEQPFFLAIGFVRPHVPFTAPEEFFEGLDKAIIPEFPENEMSDIPLLGKAMSYGFLPGGDHGAVLELGDHYWHELVRSYLACIRFVDHQVGRVLKALEESPHAENTIVVLWSDHGQMLGEKQMWRKMNLWEEATRVPLLIRDAGQDKGSIIDVPVSLLDIYPTLAKLAGLEIPSCLDGQDLMDVVRQPEVFQDASRVSAWMYGNFAVRSRDWRYIRYRDGSEELYDHRKDPGEHLNLAGQIGFEEVLEKHRSQVPLRYADPFFRPFRGDVLEELVERWDSTGVPERLR